MLNRLVAGIHTAGQTVVLLLWMAAAAVCLISLLAGILVGAWDLLAWLTKADWRTSEFRVSLAAIPIALLSGVLANRLSRLFE